VKSVWNLGDIKNRGGSYTTALRVLVKHLSRDYPDEVLKAIASVLSNKAAAQWWDEILAAYMSAKGPKAKMALGGALSAIVSKKTLPAYIEQVMNPENGSSRVVMMRALKRVRDPRGTEALELLRSDLSTTLESEANLTGENGATGFGSSLPVLGF
jgi:hypothetical protein